MCYFCEAIVDFNGIQVKPFFYKTPLEGKWNEPLLTRYLALSLEQTF